MRSNVFQISFQYYVIIDLDASKKYLILGSASRDLIRQWSETFAGRLSFLAVTPFSLNEVSPSRKLWLEGGYPKAFLAGSADKGFFWLKKLYYKIFGAGHSQFGNYNPCTNLKAFLVYVGTLSWKYSKSF